MGYEHVDTNNYCSVSIPGRIRYEFLHNWKGAKLHMNFQKCHTHLERHREEEITRKIIFKLAGRETH